MDLVDLVLVGNVGVAVQQHLGLRLHGGIDGGGDALLHMVALSVAEKEADPLQHRSEGEGTVAASVAVALYHGYRKGRELLAEEGCIGVVIAQVKDLIWLLQLDHSLHVVQRPMGIRKNDQFHGGTISFPFAYPIIAEFFIGGKEMLRPSQKISNSSSGSSEASKGSALVQKGKAPPDQAFQPDPEQIKRALTSPEGQALLRILQSDGGAGLRAASAAIQGGDMEGAKAALSPLLQDTEAEALAQRLEAQL